MKVLAYGHEIDIPTCVGCTTFPTCKRVHENAVYDGACPDQAFDLTTTPLDIACWLEDVLYDMGLLFE